MERKADGDQSDPKMEGYLEKKRKSRLVSLWHRYWFVLEGAQLSYYDSRPTSTATTGKGVIRLSSMTSVTAHSPTNRQPESHGQAANSEIYILTPCKLYILRTKDVNDHKTWMCALLGQIAKLVKGQISAVTTRNTLAVPFPSSHINYRHSLNSLTTMEENENTRLSKCSRTMEYKDFKSGSTGNMLDRQPVSPNRETDTETSSEEDLGTKHQESGINTATEGLKYKCITKEISDSTEMSNVGAILDERVENFTKVTDKIKTSSEEKVTKIVHDENKMEENENSKLTEVQSVQIQETKVKSRKFFGRRETKTNSVQMSCAKVYKKCRETVVTDRVDADPKLLQACKADKRFKRQESYSKEETMLSKRMTDSRSSNLPTDYKIPVSHSQQRVESSLPERSEGIKIPNKPKIKRVKSKKESKGSQQSAEAQSYRKSKTGKTGELPDDGETKTKVKRMGFFSKLVKCKKNENSDEIEQDSSIELSKEPETPEEEQPPAHEALVDKRVPNLPRHRAPMGLLVPKDDAEFQKKLLSRKLKIEADQEFPRKVNETENIKTDLSVTLHEKDDDEDKSVTTVNNGGEEAKPSLPPRAYPRPPPIPERKISPIQPGSKRNSPTENFPQIKPTLSPKFPQKYFNQGAEIKSNYDIVKFKVKKKESVEKTALTCSGMDYRVGQTFTLESDTTMNKSEVFSSEAMSDNKNKNSGRANVEIKVLERDKTEVDLEEEIRIVMPTITLQETSSETSSIRSVNTFEEEVLKCMNTTIDLGKRDRAEIPTTTFIETSSVKSSYMNSAAEHKSYTCSSPIPIVTFSEITSLPSSAEAELSDIKIDFNSSSETEERAFNKVDELGFLLSELDRINAAPLENVESEEKPLLTPKEAKRLSSDKEDFLEAFPIRRRRNSDPDYDIPRPHRLPKHHQESQDPDKNDFSKDDNDGKDRDTTNSITIEATCFLGPGMDQSFNENRYYGFSSNDWSRKGDEMKQYLECKYGYSDVSEEKDSLLQNLKLDMEDFERKEMKENVSEFSEKHSEESGESSQGSKRDSEISVTLRPEKIDRRCRNERSREVYQSDIDDLLNLTGTMEYLSFARTLDEERAMQALNKENGSLLQTDILHDELGVSVPKLEDSESRIKTAEVQFEAVDSIANTNKMAVKSTVVNDERLQQEKPVEMEEETEVVMRNPLRTDFSDNKTFRLSFATTETLIVEEEVLVASLKTTTTTTFSSPTEDQTSNGEKEEIEELVEEVVLDMDSIPDDHFGSMKIQSCVQT